MMRMMDNDGCYMDAAGVNLAGTVWRLGWRWTVAVCAVSCLIAAGGVCGCLLNQIAGRTIRAANPTERSSQSKRFLSS